MTRLMLRAAVVLFLAVLLIDTMLHRQGGNPVWWNPLNWY
jgi:hypothetical protein